MTEGAKPIRVLVADDSELFLDLVAKLLTAEHGFELLAIARDGAEAAQLTRRLLPDVVTMDLKMPRADGFLGIARVMAEAPTPILVLSASPSEAAGFRALSLGALDILEKPRSDADLEEYGRRLRSELHLLAGVKVIATPAGLVRCGPPRRGARGPWSSWWWAPPWVGRGPSPPS